MTNSIAELKYYDGGNAATKNLRWIRPITAKEQYHCQLLLSKDNDLVGIYLGMMPILIDDRFEKKFGAELRETWNSKEHLKFIPNQKFLLAVCNGIFALSQIDVKAEKTQTCFHVRTTFESFANKPCPDCGESVSPNLVIGYLATAIQEINEMTWEHKGEKNEKGEAAEVEEE